MQHSTLSSSDPVGSESLRGTAAEEIWPSRQEYAAEQEAGATAPSASRTPPDLPGPCPSRRNHPGPGRASGTARRR